jgi:hypothetical protein
METTIYWKRNYHRWIKKKYFTCSQIVLIIKSLREIKDYIEIAIQETRAEHFRFGPVLNQNKQLNRIFLKKFLNRTKPKTGSNRLISVRFGLVFSPSKPVQTQWSSLLLLQPRIADPKLQEVKTHSGFHG